MIDASVQLTTPDLLADSYVVLGLATCYLLQDGETIEVKIVEPIPSAYLETILKGIATSYSMVWSTTLEQALTKNFPPISAAEGQASQPCGDFEERLYAAARSFINRPQAKALIPSDHPFVELNYSTEKKRILNTRNKVSRSDNVKQHQHTHKIL
jgi:hypothetical protein